MSLKPRVVVVASLGDPPYVGGIENVVDTLLQSDLTQQFDFSVFDTYRPPDPERNKLAKLAFAGGLLRSCWSFLWKTRPAMVHIHFCSRVDFWKHSICLFAARAQGVKAIFHLHGGSFDAFYEELHSFPRALLKLVFRAPHRVIALSGYWRDFLSKFVPSERIRVLNNPIACERLAPSGSRSPDSKHPKVLLLGSLGKRKGHYDVLRALPLVLDHHPQVTVLFAGGDEDEGATTELKRLAAESGLAEHVRFLGPVAFEPKTELLRTSTMMILPSYGENMPISVLEAMAACMPVVATRVGAVPEVLNEGNAGLLIEPGDWETLAGKINQVLDDPILASRLGEAAGARARSLWDVKSIASQLETIYRETLRG